MRAVAWPFPASRPHDGIPLANGRFGALLWGGADTVRLTVNRADFWDRRWAFHWGPEVSYRNLRRLLEAGDQAGLAAAFRPPARERTTRLPMGRVDVFLPGADLRAGTLDLETATASVDTGRGALRAAVLHDRPVLVLWLPPGGTAEARPVPAWEGRPGSPERSPADFFRANGYGEPERRCSGADSGWTLARPEDEALAVAVRAQGERWLVTAVYGADPDAAWAAARAELDAAATGLEARAAATRAHWRGFWRQGARLHLPDARLADLYSLGMYKAQCMEAAGGTAATLQGSWVEEHRLPPWCGDYHFNVNVQECYWPVCAANHPELLLPLFDLLSSWEGRLREYARRFVGIEDGLLLPHAVNDRGENVGGFWTGSIDHGCTAWVGQLMWTYWRHTRDTRFLRERAYPFLRGAMRVYEAMLDEADGALFLPVSVSPEYGGAAGDAWGRNASFQLAAVHFLCAALVEAAELLDVDPGPRARWRDVAARLPRYATTPDGQEIALWEGQPLRESHRHHSHLAGLYPFATLEPEDPVLQRSLRTWVRQGMGQWTGWCVPWAAILHARTGNGDMAEALLQLFARAFVGPGHASLHDARFPGLTVFDRRPDVMQVEAAIGFAAAVQEMLLHAAGGAVRAFPAVAAAWEEVAFEDMRADGALLVSGAWVRGQVRELRVRPVPGVAGAGARVAWRDGGGWREAHADGSRGGELRLVSS